LFQEDVQFANLGVIVVDEQHRFGVRQRLMLKSKGDNPEMLTMSATPIPRTLAMSIHGDMDISVLDELPPGRTPIKTALYHSQKGRQTAYNLIRHQITLGHQAYIVYPLIDESETLAAKAATKAYEQLRTEVFGEFRIGLMHGKLRPEDRDAVMDQFLNHQIDILVCTTVVEVGVDVPNATVMIIENAERFGLSQLHQLRGRVGRSSYQSYCVLMSESKGEESLHRLGILVASEDGFYIAEKDLELRGPGEFLGTRQSGLPNFLLANLLLDQSLLELAKRAAQQMVADDPGLIHHIELAEWVERGKDQQSNVLTSG
jgi:ATP-dependent DNA helicase RecG